MARKEERDAPLDTQDEVERAEEIHRVAEEHPERLEDITTGRPADRALPRSDLARQGQPEVPVPPPLSQHELDLQARVRMKNEMREPLTEEERAVYARLQGSKEKRYDEQ